MNRLLLAHHPDPTSILRDDLAADPLRVLFSGCLLAWPCGVEGTDYGLGQLLSPFLQLPTVRAFGFCPEEHALGTPRTMPDIHGGDGEAVLAGQATVRDEHGRDLTAEMIAGAEAMREFAVASRVELAILTDMSAACGSQVISDGCRLVEDRKYQVGVGVAAATLLRAGIPVVSQRDHRTLGLLRQALDPGFEPDPTARDHHQSDWYLENYGPRS